MAESASTSESGDNVHDAQPPTAELDDSGSDTPMHIVLAVGIIALIVGIAAVIASVGVIRHWIALHTGVVHGGPDVYYNFWSGFGSDLGEATLISAVGVGVYTAVRKVNCHAKGCWRIGRHPLDGTPYILCRRHHPLVPKHGASHAQILAHYHRARAERAAERSVNSPV
jgi:hypothetical protein